MTLPTAAAYLLAATLLNGLDARHYRQRNACQRALRPVAPLILPALERLARCDARPEAAARCARLLAPYEAGLAWERALKLRPRNWPRTPWIDHGDAVVSHYLAAGKMHARKEGAPDWPEYRWATVEWVASQLRQRRSVEAILDDLDGMAMVERQWIRSWGKNYGLKVPEGY